MYAKVIDGQVTQIGLPEAYTLSDGRTVSGFDKITDAVFLKAEGWLPMEDGTMPEYNHETEYLQGNYDVQSDKVVVNYEVVEKPVVEYIPPQPTLEEIKALVESVSTDFMGFMDWYYTTHPDEA